MIRKVNGKYEVVSHKGKRLTKPGSKEKAVKDLRRIEFFKHHSEKSLGKSMNKTYAEFIKSIQEL